MVYSQYLSVALLFYRIISVSMTEPDLRDVRLAIKVFRQMNITLNEVINLLENDLTQGKTTYEPNEMLLLIR